MRDIWETVAAVAGTLLTLAAFAALVWRLALRHHVTEFVRKVSAVHKSVTVNGGHNSPPTLRDDISEVRAQLAQLVTQSGAVAQHSSGLADRLDDLHELVQETRDDVRRHEETLDHHLDDHHGKGNTP